MTAKRLSFWVIPDRSDEWDRNFGAFIMRLLDAGNITSLHNAINPGLLFTMLPIMSGIAQLRRTIVEIAHFYKIKISFSR